VRVVTLPDDLRALDVADGAREAMLSILRGVGGSWGRRELAEWLQGPYRILTDLAAVPESLENSRTFRRIPRSVEPARLEEVLRAAKEDVLATMILAAPPDSDVRFSHRAVAAGHLVRTRDAAGRAGWVPVDAPGMLLGDRILSLAAVDYLMRPADYLALLSVCGICHAVSFDAQVRVRGHCAEHRHIVGKLGVSAR
jgi:hypothetical protein